MQALNFMKDLDKALDEVTQAHDDYVNAIEDDDQKKTAQKTFEEAHASYENTVDKISTYLQERKDEPPSSVMSQGSQTGKKSRSGAHASQTGATHETSKATRDAEIELQVKQLKLEQLNRQILQETEQEQLKEKQLREQREQKQKHTRQKAEDEVEAAKLEATLRKAAESSLEWERRNDFANEDITNKHQEEELEKKTTPPVPSASKGLPRLSLRTFSGNPSEWPAWSGLFDALVHNDRSLSTTEKMVYLQSSVGGIARDLISGMLCDPNLYEEALFTLRERFGREQDIVQAKLNTIFSRPCVSMKTLESFYADVNSAVTVLDRLGFTGDLNSQENLRRLVEKLPSDLKREWAKHMVSLAVRPNLIEFNKWLKLQVRIALNCMSASISERPSFTPALPRRGRLPEPQVTAAFVTTTQNSHCVCCG